MSSHQSNGIELARLFAGNCTPSGCDWLSAAASCEREQQRFLATRAMRGRGQEEAARQFLSQLRLCQTSAVTREDPDWRMIVDREALVRPAVVERDAQQIGVVLEVRRQLETQLAREEQVVIAGGHGIAVGQFGDGLRSAAGC